MTKRGVQSNRNSDPAYLNLSDKLGGITTDTWRKDERLGRSQ
jgi:hypothetical protein